MACTVHPRVHTVALSLKSVGLMYFVEFPPTYVIHDFKMNNANDTELCILCRILLLWKTNW